VKQSFRATRSSSSPVPTRHCPRRLRVVARDNTATT
jgi:hypothetical protein